MVNQELGTKRCSHMALAVMVVEDVDANEKAD